MMLREGTVKYQTYILYIRFYSDTQKCLSRCKLVVFDHILCCLSLNRYNTALTKTRVYIEHAFGMLKRRFPIVGGRVRYRNLAKVCRLIVATCILHNIGIDNQDLYDDNVQHDEEQNENNVVENNFQPTRAQIVVDFFSQ